MSLYLASQLGQMFELVGLVIVFVIILVVAYFVTKWIGTSGITGTKSNNIKVIETYKITQSKYIQILRIADKYVAVAVCKDHIEYLTEINEEEIILPQTDGASNINFLQILKNVKNNSTKTKDK